MKPFAASRTSRIQAGNPDTDDILGETCMQEIYVCPFQPKPKLAERNFGIFLVSFAPPSHGLFLAISPTQVSRASIVNVVMTNLVLVKHFIRECV